MNELYAAEPSVFSHASELKLLMASFGPYAGRYLANYPSDWAAQVEMQLENLGDIEAARIKIILRRAKESTALISWNGLAWNKGQEWLENARPLLNAAPAMFEGLIARQAIPPAIHNLHELDLPPTAEERIAGKASEYARISKTLLVLSPEISLVDPYLNPLKRDCAAVLKAMFETAAMGKCEKVSLWVRESEVRKRGTYAVMKADLEDCLRRLARQASFKPGREIELVLIEDESRQAKMHDRYLLSIKGGIRFGQGFQELPQGRHVDVGPVGKTTHDALLDIYFDGKHDMRVVERLAFKC
jgi:hypothetical protein